MTSVSSSNTAGNVIPGSPEAIRLAAEHLRPILAEPPVCFGVLGSGLGAMAQQLEDRVAIPFRDIPGFPGVAVSGHAGEMVFGYLAGCPVLLQAGRFHGYEGYPSEVVVAPVRVAAALEIPVLLVTNAAGGIHRRFGPGTLMLISDQLNLTGDNPLVGPVRPGEIRFPDMTQAYDRDLQAMARAVALETRTPLEEGVYAGLRGPSYETPAEVRMLGHLGADAVGMSTVHEVIVARALGLRVLGISLITNAGAGLSPQTLDHKEVLEAGTEAAPRLQRIVRGVVARLGIPSD